jgi:hypothetical protein
LTVSPEQPKRRGVSLATPSPMKKIKMKPIPPSAKLYPSIIEVRPDGPEESRHEVKTGQVTKIWFNKFCDEGDYEEYISGARTGDIDPELFDFNQFCKLIEEDGKFKCATGQLELKKEERRYDFKGDADYQARQLATLDYLCAYFEQYNREFCSLKPLDLGHEDQLKHRITSAYSTQDSNHHSRN